MLLTSLLSKEKDFEPLLFALKKENKPILVSGIASSLRELFPAAVMEKSGDKALILLPDEVAASSLAKALASLSLRSFFFPPRDFSLVQMDASGRDFSLARLEVLTSMLRGDFDVVVTTFEAACQVTVPPEGMKKNSRTLAVGENAPKEEILSLLLRCGYEKCHRVEGPGQFAARGDIVDVFLSTSQKPCRIELFGDEVDSMGTFDPVTQRREENIFSLAISPAQEIVFTEEDLSLISDFVKEEIASSRPAEKEKRVFLRSVLERIENGMDIPQDLFLPLVYRHATLMDYLTEETVFLYDQNGGKESLDRAKHFLEEELKSLLESGRTPLLPEKAELLESFEDLRERILNRPTLLMENFFAGKSLISPSGIFAFRTRSAAVGYRTLAELAARLEELEEEGYEKAVLCENSLAAQNLFAYLTEAGKACRIANGKEDSWEKGVTLLLSRSVPGGSLVSCGFELSDSRFALVTDLSGEGKVQKKKKKREFTEKSAKKKLLSYTDLALGDYVVHSGHGIGIFRGVEKMKSADGTQKDFIKIAYHGSDVLYVPCSNLDSVSKYIGPKSDSANLKLNRLGGTDWQKAKSGAKKSAQDIAKKLTELYARRQKSRGFAFSPDTTWQKEFEDAFPYGETEGQLRATAEIKADMEKSIPMDRLLCGDVGFGKTEVALRGVFKCVMDNKQAAILVPTTILAWQHYQTLLTRFKGYPVRIEMVSRFVSKKDQKKILERLSRGEVDILVGTHRLLQEDVRFSDLGFLVIDEEQRFGVTHKEKLKEISAGVDVLTLTATPIPRTLNMALGGIKDMSLLEEAPEDRFPVQTYVLEYDRGLIEEAIRREMRRQGQVFYLHNNIEELNLRLPALQRAFPEASIAVAHGKMDRDDLSEIWKDMMDHKIDILLCTTIVETGVDLPDANTLIVEDADHFGLSQLHQIRGRVGRSDRRAFAFLTYRKGKALTEIGVKRLEAIREYTRFGSGFQIALRDLEIRGAGNLLGAEQSGHLDSVGYEMFMQILEDAVLTERGEKPRERVECTVDLSLDGYIPEKYVPYPAERMELYRKIASLRTEEDSSDLLDEMLDRFGEVPRQVDNLFSVALLRARAEEAGCEKIHQNGQKIFFRFVSAEEEALALLSAVYASRLSLSFGAKSEAVLTLAKGEKALEGAKDFLVHLEEFTKEIINSRNGKDIEK